MKLPKSLSTDFFRVATFQDLTKINDYLFSLGLPPYHLGGTKFNYAYKISNSPRFVLSFRGLRMTQVYLKGIANLREPAFQAFAIFEGLVPPLPEQIETREIVINL